jgi:hypothetical protein
MASKKEHDAARAKAAKEKKLLFVLAPLFAVAVFFAYHTLTKLNRSSEPTGTPVAATTPAGPTSAPSTTTPATTTPATATPATGTPVAITVPAGGKLARLGLFSVKDPFHDQGPRVSSTSSSSSQSKKSKPAKKTPAVPPTSAVIGVNGKPFDVAIGGSIPLNAAFGAYLRLRSLTQRTATLVIPGQKRPLRLTVGDAIRLRDQAGHAYVIVLFPQGTVVSSSPTTAPPTTTTTGP